MATTGKQERVTYRMARALLDTLEERHGLAPINLEVSNRMTSTHGLAICSKRLIKVSVYATDWKDTLKHEVAHIIAGHANGHNNVWKRACLMVGARPRRCARESNIEQTARYIYHCPCGRKIRRRNRASANQICTKCNTSVLKMRVEDATISHTSPIKESVIKGSDIARLRSFSNRMSLR